ncbi:hypothetical protein [Dapis sp. BLCC M126]
MLLALAKDSDKSEFDQEAKWLQSAISDSPRILHTTLVLPMDN